ncbi:MAG: ERF family protein [Bacilli bacterium]|nr:ERF family protein [Bacilli bacterium]
MENKKLSLYEKLSELQNKLNVPKKQYNSFGNYYYRSCDDIMEASKPICKELKCVLTCEDKIVSCDGRFYVEATARLHDLETGESISITASAREDETKKGMDGSQITGASSSYARKYALNGLLQLDDNKDADTNEHYKQNKTNTTKKATTKTASIKTSITDAQVKTLQILLKEQPEGTKEKLYAKLKIESCKELSSANADKIIKQLREKKETK